MTAAVKPERSQSEGQGVGQAGDNRRAGDQDGNEAAGDSKSPGVAEPNEDKKTNEEQRTK